VRLLALLFCTISLAACEGSNVPAAPEQIPEQVREQVPGDTSRIAAETARLNAWLDARYEEQLEFSPIEQTTLGRKSDYDRIDEMSEAAQKQELAWRRQTVDDLRSAFDYALLTPDAKLSYDLWVYDFERAAAAEPFRRREYVFTQMDGPHTALPQFLINSHRVDDASDMSAYGARIRESARAIEQALERARVNASEGVRPPRWAYDAVIEQARAVVTGAPFDGANDSPLWADAQSKIRTLEQGGKIDSAQANALAELARAALTEHLGPAYRALIAWLESDRSRADEIAAGVGKLPDGAAFYEERLASSTTTTLSAEEIHEIGLREVARLTAEMEAAKDRLGFNGTLQELFAFLRSDPQFYFPNDDAGREAYLAAARADLDVIRQRLPEYFSLLPKAELVVKRVEAFREQPGAPQHYFPAAVDGSRPGIFYAHLLDMNAMPRPQLPAIAYHEGLPGHHMQISIAQELTEVPTFRTQALFTAYVEGWALYAELLAKEMGAYQDGYADFSRLTTEIWRAVRLVVDTGLHAKGWSEQQAVDYFTNNSAAAAGQIRAEIRRYIVTPGQATSYKVGMLKILELRSRAQSQLGERFDIREFHDAVLGGGSLPLPLLERRVDEWITAARGAN
jgi:uncharacterized protein (DUF885 family)